MKYTTRRRDFLKAAAAGGVVAMLAACKRNEPASGSGSTTTQAAATTGATSQVTGATKPTGPVPPSAAVVRTGTCRIALTNGEERPGNILRALKAIESDVKQAIGNRRVIIKPNITSATKQLACTHPDALAAILDFLKAIGKLDNAIIAESAPGNTMDAFKNFSYTKLADKYKIRLVDLDGESSQLIMAFSQNDARPHPVRVSSLLMDQSANFIISTTPLKTHDRVIGTLGIVNIVFGAALKEGPGSNNKATLHGDGVLGINDNLALLAPMLHPSLTVLDGFEGMEGEGPNDGTPVNHKVCLASMDYLAADIVGASLMGINPADIGYLYYLSYSNVGVADSTKWEILGEPVAKLAQKYKLHSTTPEQLKWKNNARVVGA